MHIRPDTDKDRFVDLDARKNGALVHTVEVSDSRSTAHFITLFFKGRTPETDGFVFTTGLREDNHHDPEIYHRDEPKTRWVLETFPEKGPPWTFHWHKRLNRPPTLADVRVFKPGIPAALWAEIEQVLGTRPAPRPKATVKRKSKVKHG